MITYKLTNHYSVLRTDSETEKIWDIPLGSNNWMSQEYLEWVAQGNEPEPADE